MNNVTIVGNHVARGATSAKLNKNSRGWLVAARFPVAKTLLLAISLSGSIFTGCGGGQPDDGVGENGGINFLGFYLGMPESAFQSRVAHYRLQDGEWDLGVVPSTKQVYWMNFSLKSVRIMTHGGDSFAELAQEVANHVGTMEPKYDDDYNMVGYEYKNIDDQLALILEKDGLILKDVNLARKARNESEEAERKADAEREEAERKALIEASKMALSKLAEDMVAIPGKDCSICKYEVTQALWFAVMGDNPSDFSGADCPVEQVSLDDCQKFLEKLNSLPEVKASGFSYRLPSEEEWEYACRAGGSGNYCKLADGTEITKDNLGDVAWYKDNSEKKTQPVGQKKPNAFGLYDMLGNVDEWTSTVDTLKGNVICGGSFSSESRGCEAVKRDWGRGGFNFNWLGFRLAR